MLQYMIKYRYGESKYLNFLIIFQILLIESFDYSWQTIEEILMSIMQELLSWKWLLNEA